MWPPRFKVKMEKSKWICFEMQKTSIFSLSPPQTVQGSQESAAPGHSFKILEKQHLFSRHCRKTLPPTGFHQTVFQNQKQGRVSQAHVGVLLLFLRHSALYFLGDHRV